MQQNEQQANPNQILGQQERDRRLDYLNNPEATLAEVSQELHGEAKVIVEAVRTLQGLVETGEIDNIAEKLKGVGVGQLNEDQMAEMFSLITERLPEVGFEDDILNEVLRYTQEYLGTVKKGKDGTEITGKQIMARIKNMLDLKDFKEWLELKKRVKKQDSEIDKLKDKIDSVENWEKRFLELQREMTDLRGLIKRQAVRKGGGGGGNSISIPKNETFHIQTEDGTNILTEDGTNVDHQ